MRPHVLRAILLAATVAMPCGVVAGADVAGELPAGLEVFLDARLLESEGRYREAVESYEEALRLNPGQTEIRVRLAALLVQVGLADRAVELLDEDEALDWYGLRVRALALAQVSARRPDLVDDAERAIRAALAERDDDPNLMLSLGQVLHRSGELAEAERIVADLRASHGGSLQLVSYHARLLEELGSTEQAVDLYATCAAATSPIAYGCRERVVELLVELGREGEAGALMVAWLDDEDLDQLMRAAVLLSDGGRDEHALRTVRRVLRVEPDSPRARALEAYLLSSLGRYGEAAVRLRDLLRRNPDDVDLLLTSAWAEAKRGDAEQARVHLDRAWEGVAVDAGSEAAARVALSAARVELLIGSPLRARDWLARVAGGGAAGPDWIRLLAETYRREEAWSEGLAAILRAQPTLAEEARDDARALEAELRFRLGDDRAWPTLRTLLDDGGEVETLMALQVLQAVERWQDAEREAAAALERHPRSRDLRFTRAVALERLGRLDEASAELATVIERYPDDAAALNYLGYTWADEGIRLEEARELLERAVELDPENPAYLDSLGWVHFRLGDIEQAEHWLRRSVELGGDDGTILAHLGEVLLAKGDDDGRRYLRQALDLGCEDPERVRQLLDDVGVVD